MWEIIRAELMYSRFAYLVFFVTIPLLVMLQVVGEGGERIYVTWFVVLMMVNYWNAKRIREKRDFFLSQLPVSRREIGRARALMVILTSASYMIVYSIIKGAVEGTGLNIQYSSLIFGVVVMMFSLVLMLRDRFLGSKNLMRGKVLLIVMLGAFAAIGFYMMVVTDDAIEAGTEPPAVLRVFDYVIKLNPMGHPLYLTCFVAASLVLAYLSVITYQRRRSNVE